MATVRIVDVICEKCSRMNFNILFKIISLLDIVNNFNKSIYNG
jgi:hypothetical protein